MLLWVLPVVAIGIGGWVIYARSRRRVRVVPEAFPEQSVQEGKRAGYIVYLPGIVVALIVAGVSYYQTGNYQQVKIWQQATAQTPALLDRALDPKADPLNEEEMSRLALGMRTQLQKNPGDIEGWIMLGRVGMALGNASIATDAYATAYRLDPKNSDAALGYAEALTRSSDPNDNRLGGELLRQLVRTDHRTIIHTQTDLKAQFPDLSDTIEELENSGKLTVITQTCTAPGLYHLGDVYVYPSRLEGIGLTIAESISCGLACVVTDNPPMNEFVDGSIGDTIPVKRFYSRQDGYYWPQCDCDVTELAELLEKYASDKQLVLTQKKAARQYALEHLSYKKNFRKLFDLFDTIQYAAASESLERQINSFDSYGLKRLQKYYLRYGLYKLRRS